MAVPLAGGGGEPARRRQLVDDPHLLVPLYTVHHTHRILWLPLMQLLRLQPGRGLGAPSLIWRWALQLIGQVLSRPARPALAAVQPPQPADLREAPGMLSSVPVTLGNDRVLC